MKRPRTLVGRLFIWQLVVVAVAFLALGLTLDQILERNAVSGLTSSLVREAHAVNAARPSIAADLQAFTVAQGDATGLRITLIDPSGAVLADSEADPTTLENHADRPEVQAALHGEIGTAQRRSVSTGDAYLYAAIPPVDEIIVRVAVPLTEVRAGQGQVRAVLVAGLFVAAAATAGGVALVARAVAHPLRSMGDDLVQGRPIMADVANRPAELYVLATALRAATDRVAAEAASARDAQATRDLILSSMDEGVLFIAPDDTVVFSNAAAQEHLGHDADTAEQLPLTIRNGLRTARSEGTISTGETDVGTPARWLRFSAVPVEGQVLIALRDVTESRRVDAVRRDFVANASHELKTPAASIMAAAETLSHAATDDPDVVPRFAAQIEKESLRLSRIVSDLLDLSRLDSQTSLVTETVQLHLLIQEEATRTGDDRISVSTKAATVVGAERDIALLVRNLIDNALRYSPDDGTVRVSLGIDEPDAVLTVQDTGIGIPTYDLPRIFERFYRVDQGRSRETGGTGLGLSIVKHVAEGVGGGVHVTSELGIGTSFEVRLPLADVSPSG